MNKELAAELVGVSKIYRNGIVALNDVSVGFEPGKITVVLGPNGAGKTTAIKLMLGLTTPTKGTVHVFGGNPRASATRTRIGAMMQVSKVPETLKVKEHIDIFRSYYPNAASRKDVLKSTGVEALENRLFGQLSGGEKQRVMLALALCGNPDLLFLDEPTVGMDVESRRLLWDQIRAAAEQGRAVLLTTHYLDEADALAQRVVVINKGSVIADGAAHEIKQRVSLRRIRCTTGLSDNVIAKMRGVETVRRSPGSVEIMTSAAESVVRELLAQDQSLSGLEVTGAGLEDAFIALTKENA